MSSTARSRWIFVVLLTIAVIGGFCWRALACPFCSAVALTLSEEIDSSQVAIIAKLVQAPKPAKDGAADSAFDVSKAKFEIVKILKGDEILGRSRTVETIFFGESPLGSTFLIMGIDPPAINWGTPIALSDRGQDYIAKAMDLPKDGTDRLAFFQEYLEDRDESLSRDAYDEFAKISYADVRNLKDRMHHDQLVEWIKNPQVPASRRRLYLTMLGICGTAADAPMLEEMIKSKDRQTRGALDALVAAYLTLKGPDGMGLVEDLFLKDKNAEYTDTYATIIALRFHGTEEKVIPRDTLLHGIRMMLDRPQLADLVIPDLARWEDWSAMNKLVELFKNADEESSWVRVPVITFLRVCPLPEAKAHIQELAKLDPETVKRAEAFYPFAGASGVSSGDPPANTPAAPAGTAPTEKGTTKQKTAPTLATPDASATSAASTPASSAPVFGGLVVSAVVLGCAVWTIFRGGQRI